MEHVLRLAGKLTVTRTATQHCPLTPATRGMIGAPELRSMKRGALLVNFGRGELIDKQVPVTARQAAMRDALFLGPTALLTGTLCCRGTWPSGCACLAHGRGPKTLQP